MLHDNFSEEVCSNIQQALGRRQILDERDKKLFAEVAGIQGPLIQLRQVIDSWWNATCCSKLKPFLKAVPAFIIWSIWKRRNVIRNGGFMSKHALILNVNRMIPLLVKVRYSWLKEIPNTWPLLVKHLEEYTSSNCCKVVTWKLPSRRIFKCNTDGCSKGKPSLSAVAFCIRNDEGAMLYAEAKKIGEASAIEAEMKAVKLGLEYCVQKGYLPLTNEIDSLITKKNPRWSLGCSLDCYYGCEKHKGFNAQ
ncbi:hypothetical protein R3W88_020049 [Solanum pinnatisectum]|uniref:RNase H type-1 domain-containing protein n=1 Tax=Solanum pinnatisectum TaxID=50273 RepID=A0AAV9KL69_9SOLN|nr:hypothetical protein R3W88_020049 [Solanum pinnatisectum]